MRSAARIARNNLRSLSHLRIDWIIHQRIQALCLLYTNGMRGLSLSQLVSILFVSFVGLLLASGLDAWVGPTNTPPQGNVAAPINVGTTSQIKDGTIGVEGLAVFGTAYIQTKLGVGILSPVVSIQTPGSIKIGDGGEVCQSVTAGAQRYNSTTRQMEFCDGSSWRSVSSGQVLHIQHRLPAGVSPGSGTANTWYTRPLNTVSTNEITGASLANNRVTLPAGSYEISAHVSTGCATYASYQDQIRIRNITDGTTVAVGLMGFLARGSTATGDAGGNASFIPYSRFTITGTKSFELQHYTWYAMYLGCASIGGEEGVYADVVIRKF